MSLFSWIKGHFFESLLFAIILFLCLQNYTPGTFLIGWDNLMPELNLGLNLKRSFFAVWQQYQGLGLVGGMAHATDLIRQLLLLPFTLILPPDLIRYLWHFAMLFLGSFGLYFGLKKLRFSPLISFSSALFYLLNFGSVQYFRVPLESFSTFWGFFPWLIFAFWEYLDKGKNLKKLLLLNILAIPSFYVQTIFLVYLFCLILISFSHFLIYKKIKFVKKYFYFFFILFLINSFWLLPQFYFLKTNLQNPTAGIGNFMSNDETFARNLARGHLSDFLLLRGYYYDFPSTGTALMAPWQQHFSNSYSLLSGYLLSFVVFLGLISLFYHFPENKKFYKYSLLWLFFLSALALLSALPPFNYLNSFLRSIPVVNQIFRSPWTKFLVPAAFVFSYLFALGLNFLSRIATSLHYSAFSSRLPLYFSLVLLFFFSLPSFQGNYFSPQVRQKIPYEYFQIFDFLNKKADPAGRIANLPQGSFWGWSNYKWNLSGSGFIWYALPQPILDRAFDAWNLKNEQYYWELSHALQSQDPVLLNNLFSKYFIQYILFDNNLYFPDDKIYGKLSTPTKNLLDSLPNLKLIKQSENISLYETNYPTRPALIPTLPPAQSFSFALIDRNYQNLGDYLALPHSSNNFVNYFTNRLQSELNFDPQSLNLTADPQANLGREFSNSQEPVFAWHFPNASLSQNYLARIDSRHDSGLPLKVSLISDNLKSKYFDTLLPSTPQSASWFYIPSRQNYTFDRGLNFIFNNQSFAIPNQNTVTDIILYPLPPSPPAKMSLQSRHYLTSTQNIFSYRLSLENASGHLILPQSFDSGWLAFYLKNGRLHFLPDHTLTNNWANGWLVPPELSEGGQQTIYLLFWPQILEFLGLFFLILILIFLLSPRFSRRFL